MYVLLTSDPTTEPTKSRTDELIAELRDRVRSLDDQLDQEREANRENRRIIAALTSRIPAIEAPSDAPESPETVDEQQGRGVSPGPMPQNRRRAHGGRGGVGCSVGEMGERRPTKGQLT